MKDTVEEYLDGEFHIDVRLKTEFTKSQFLELDRCIEAFISAIENGMFMPARLLDNFIDLFSGDEPKRTLRKSIVVRNLPAGAFRILKGMLTHLESTSEPFESVGVFQDYGDRNYLDNEADYPVAYKQPIFFKDNNGHIIEPRDLIVRIEFANSFDEERKENYIKTIKDWNCLLSGGFQSASDTSHFSSIESSITHFIDANTLENTLKMFQGKSQCFDLIKNLSLNWNEDHPIQSVSID